MYNDEYYFNLISNKKNIIDNKKIKYIKTNNLKEYLIKKFEISDIYILELLYKDIEYYTNNIDIDNIIIKDIVNNIICNIENNI